MDPLSTAAAGAGPGLSQGLMPPAAPLAMPVQDLTKAPAAHHAPRRDPARPLRWAALGGAVALHLTLVALLGWWLAEDGLSPLDMALIALVGLVGLWLALAASTALVGLLPETAPPGGPSTAGHGLQVALLIPVYHEDPDAVAARALAMLRDIAAHQTLHRFSLFILSDTRGDIAAEIAALHRLRALAPAHVPVYYRWRVQNTDRKSGNIADWLRGWGAAQEAMVVLDADSLMGAESLLALADEMARDPRLGLIQTAPQLIGATTLFARMQAFAGAAYGPVFGRGLARWSGENANFWGHNAIIRTAAFAEAAGLPKLSAWRRNRPAQLIWSHDFVEAALLRRAGWSVRLRPELGQSFEETPPSLIDHVLRDRRWCQGNLQHLRLLGSADLTWLSRLHLLQGAASYLVSPGWLALLIVWSASSVTTPAAPRDPMGGWPVLVATLTLLLLPKAVALGQWLRHPPLCRAFGGRGRLLRSAALELLLSMLFAPILMVQQSRTILSLCAGTTIGWAPQNRGDGRYGVAALLAFHRLETALGILLLGAVAARLVPLWLLPVALSLAGAVPVSWLSARPLAPALLRTPQDRECTPVQRRLFEARAALAEPAPAPLLGVAAE